MDSGDTQPQLGKRNSSQERRVLCDKIVDFAENYLRRVERAQIPSFRMKEGKAVGLLDCAFDDLPKDIDSLLSVIEEHVIGSGIDFNRHTTLGTIPGGGTYLAALGDYLAAVLNRHSGDFASCPGAVRMDNMVISWTAKLFNFPDGFAGNLASGGSAGTVLSFLAARHSKGLRGEDFKRVVVYMTNMTHKCAQISLMTVGLFEAIIREVPMDDNFRMDSCVLRDLIIRDSEAGLLPFLVVATIGTTSAGSVDPIEKIAHVAEEYNLWLHVDAAYGGYFVLVEELQDFFRGVNRADSVVLDPHKSLHVPWGTSVVIVRDGHKLRDAIQGSTEQPAIPGYLQEFDGYFEESPRDLSFELTKHNRALRIWLPLQFYGVAAFRESLTEKIQLCKYAYRSIKEIPGFKVDCPPQLTTITFHYELGDDNANETFNTAVREKIVADGTFYVSSTRIRGQFRLRICILHLCIHKDTIDDFLALLKKYLAELKAE